MLFSKIDILDEQFEHHTGYYVGVKEGKIAYLGPTPPEEDFGEVYDGSGKLLMPGFVNAHSHSAMTLMRGYAENMALSDWLNRMDERIQKAFRETYFTDSEQSWQMTNTR